MAFLYYFEREFIVKRNQKGLIPMNNNSRRVYIFSALIMLVFYMFIAFCVPYCHDDWEWGIQAGMNQWLNATLNSRYVGSFFVIVMTRSQLLKTLIIGFTLFSIPLLIDRIAGKELNVKRYIISNFLLLFIPKEMWQQTHGWVSAFANYVISVALTFFLILVLERTKEGRTGAYWFLLPLAVAIGLFHENLTVYIVGVIVVFTIYCWIRSRRINAFHIAMTLFAIIGCLIMFSNSVYDSLIDEGVALGGVRALSFDLDSGILGMAHETLKRFFTRIFPEMFFRYPTAAVVSTGMLVWETLHSKRSVFKIILSAIAIALCVVVCIVPNGAVCCTPISICLFILDIVLIVQAGGENVGKKLMLLLSVPAVLLPLAVTTEFGPRLCYLPYMMLVAVGVCAMPTLSARFEQTIGAVFTVVLTVCVVFYIGIYTQIFSVTIDRAVAVSTAVESGASEVVMKKDPYKYWWGRNCGKERIVFFKEFYGIPENVTVIFE